MKVHDVGDIDGVWAPAAVVVGTEEEVRRLGGLLYKDVVVAAPTDAAWLLQMQELAYGPHTGSARPPRADFQALVTEIERLNSAPPWVRP